MEILEPRAMQVLKVLQEPKVLRGIQVHQEVLKEIQELKEPLDLKGILEDLLEQQGLQAPLDQLVQQDHRVLMGLLEKKEIQVLKVLLV